MTLPIVTPILLPPGTVSIGRPNIATARDGLTSLSMPKHKKPTPTFCYLLLPQRAKRPPPKSISIIAAKYATDGNVSENRPTLHKATTVAQTAIFDVEMNEGEITLVNMRNPCN